MSGSQTDPEQEAMFFIAELAFTLGLNTDSPEEGVGQFLNAVEWRDLHEGALKKFRSLHDDGGMEVLDLIREIKRELAADRLEGRFDRFEYKPT